MDVKSAEMAYDTAAKGLAKMGAAAPLAGRRGAEKKFVEAFMNLVRAHQQAGNYNYMVPKGKYRQ